eukprot:2441967-Rhodomonas_salina.1
MPFHSSSPAVPCASISSCTGASALLDSGRTVTCGASGYGTAMLTMRRSSEPFSCTVNPSDTAGPDIAWRREVEKNLGWSSVQRVGKCGHSQRRRILQRRGRSLIASCI